jgi:hypothetical protein
MELYLYCPYILSWCGLEKLYPYQAVINHYQHRKNVLLPFYWSMSYPFPILPENIEGFYFHLRLWALSNICHDYDHIPSYQSLKVLVFLNVLQ